MTTKPGGQDQRNTFTFQLHTMAVRSTLAFALAACGAASIIPRVETGPGFLSYPIIHEKRDTVIRGRDDQITIYNESSTTYLLELKIGTPPQDVLVVLDTGSFELWVDPTCSGVSNSQQAADCQAAGMYHQASSSTVVDVGATNQLPYGKGVVDIAYVQDNIQVPGTGSECRNHIRITQDPLTNNSSQTPRH